MSILSKLFGKKATATTAAIATIPQEPDPSEFFPIIELELGAVLNGKRCECSRSLQAQEALKEFLASPNRLCVKFCDDIVHAWHDGKDLGVLRSICRRPGFLLEVEYETRRSEDYTQLMDRDESGIVRKTMMFCE